MQAQARISRIETHWENAHPAVTRHGRQEKLARLYIRLACLRSIFVATTDADVAIVGSARDPATAAERIQASQNSNVSLRRVWWCDDAEAAIIHVAFAANAWPIYEVAPAVLAFARQHDIALIPDAVLQTRISKQIREIDSEFDTLNADGIKKFDAVFVAERERRCQLGFRTIGYAEAIHRFKLRVLGRVAQRRNAT